MKKLLLIVVLVVMGVVMTACSPDENIRRRVTTETQAGVVQIASDVFISERI